MTLSRKPTLWGSLLVLETTAMDGALRWSATPAHIPLTSIAPSLLAGVAHRTFPHAMR